MARHGSLCPLTIRSGHCRADQVSICALILALVLTSPIFAEPVHAESAPIDAHFRLQWPAETDRQDWIRVEVVQSDDSQVTASIGELRNRSQSPMSTGAFHMSDDRRVLTFRPRAALKDGGVDFRIQAAMDAQISIQVADRTKFENASECFRVRPENQPISVPLKDVLGGTEFQPPLDSVATSGAKWTLRRLEHDGLRIALDHSDGLYEPSADSKVKIRMSGRSLPQFANQSQRLHAAIYRVADDSVVASNHWTTKFDIGGHSDEIAWQLDVPAVAGVYEIRCEIKEPESRIWSRLRRQESLMVSQSRPFVVLAGSDHDQSSDAREWRKIALIRPTDTDRGGINTWLPVNGSRLIPLAPAPTQKRLQRGEHDGQATAFIEPGEIFESPLPTLVPGLPQKVTIRYPAIPSARFRLEVIHADEASSSDFILAQGPSIAADGPWIEHTFAYYPDNGPIRLRVTNLSQTESAMIESISVLAGPAQLRSLELVDSKRADSDQRLSVYSLTDFEWVETFSHDTDLTRLTSRFSPDTVSLHRLTIATKRLGDYLCFSGMNAVVIPVIANHLAWLETSVLHPTRLDGDVDSIKIKLCMRMLESSQLRVFAGVESSTTLADVEQWIHAHEDQISSAIRDPEEGPIASQRYSQRVESYNPLHPAVQGAMISLTGEVNEVLRTFKNFAGVSVLCAGHSHLSPLTGKTGFDHQTLKRFASSPMVATEKVPQSPALARVWAAQDPSGRFITWRRNQLCGLYRLVAEGIDGKTLLRFSAAAENRAIYQSLAEHRVDRTLGVDAIESTKSNLVLVNEIRRVPVGSLPSRSRLDHEIQPSGYALHSQPDRDIIDVGFCITDSRFHRAPTKESDHLDDAPQPILRYRTTIDVAQILEQSNPTVLMFDSSSTTTTINPELSEVLRDWVALPTNTVAEIEAPDPAAATARLRFGLSDGKYYLMAINWAPWPSDVVVQTSSVLAWRRVGVNASVSLSATGSNDFLEINGVRTRLKLRPRQMVVLCADAIQTDVQVLDWYARASGGKEQLDLIASQVSKIVDRLGGLTDPPTYESLSNGSFESDSSVGLVGWLHAQHPPGAVRIDNHESLDGRHSALLSTEQNDGDRSWLVSEVIQPPRSGRLAVSLACRAELGETNTTHRLRVSIEGTRAGEPIRQSADVEVPHNGKWQPRQLVLEVEGVDPSTVDLLRLTIDSLTRGRVWIDDVRLHDWFPVAKERSELQGEAYVAVQGLQRGSLTPAARLIQNEWAQHLLSIQQPEPPDVIDVAQPEEPPPGVAERLRNWLPSPLRF